MRILMATSEFHPYSKTGGLADMVAALTKTLAQKGHRVGVVTPLYRGIREKFPELRPFDWQMTLPLGGSHVSARIWIVEPVAGMTIYFVDQPGFFDRPGIYNENGADYADNAARFIFFSKAAIHLARYLPWGPQVMHVHDWQTGLVPMLVQQQRLAEGWGKATPVMLTIHNLAYQGIFAADAFALANLPASWFNPGTAEFHGALNMLKAGIATADVITTVSPRYAREIMTEEFGCGLDGLLRHRADVVHGVLNGVDYEEWNTTTNPHLKFHYRADQLAGKTRNKTALQKELGLPVNPRVPLFGSVTRLAEQKGVDLLVPALEEMLGRPMQFVLLGSGDGHYERSLRSLARRHPDKVAIRIGYDQGLSHRIEAACDFFLMPSRFEPCGLNQMYSLRYGTIPIVRATGGLDDSVVDPSENQQEATGIKFTEYSAAALAHAMRKALALYATKPALRAFRERGMKADFSWETTANRYLQLYGTVMK